MSSNDHKQDFKQITLYGARIIWLLEVGGLCIIAIATLIAGYIEVTHMINKMSIDLSDLLLLFLYLEILAMVGIYLESGSLPVRLPMYISIVALARYLIIDAKNMEDARILAVTGGILIISIGVLILNFTHTRFPRRQTPNRSD